MRKERTMTTLLIGVGIVILAALVIIVEERKQERTICSYCGLTYCDGEHEDSIEEIALAKLDRSMQEREDAVLLAPWLKAIEGM
jgi:hypothetical protein